MGGFLVLLLIALGFIYVFSKDVTTEEKHICDYNCKSYDIPICASNQMCTIRFVGKCMMEMYNCLYPHKAFRQVEDLKCGDSWIAECSNKASIQ